MEFKAVQQVQRLPFLLILNLSLDSLRSNDETMDLKIFLMTHHKEVLPLLTLSSLPSNAEELCIRITGPLPPGVPGKLPQVESFERRCSSYPRSPPRHPQARVPGSAGAKQHPGWHHPTGAPRPRTHPHTALSSVAASRSQPRSRATAASSQPGSATPPGPGSSDAGGSCSDKSPCPRSRSRHSSPKAPTWKARVLSSGISYSGKLLLATGSCSPQAPLLVGTPWLLSAMFAPLPSLQKPEDQGLAQRDGTCSCTWPGRRTAGLRRRSFRHYISRQAPGQGHREPPGVGLSSLFSTGAGRGAVVDIYPPPRAGFGSRPPELCSISACWLGRPPHAHGSPSLPFLRPRVPDLSFSPLMGCAAASLLRGLRDMGAGGPGQVPPEPLQTPHVRINLQAPRDHQRVEERVFLPVKTIANSSWPCGKFDRWRIAFQKPGDHVGFLSAKERSREGRKGNGGHGFTWTQGRVASPGPGTQPHPDPGAHGLTQTQGHVASPGPRGAASPGPRTQPHPDPGRVASPGPGIQLHPDPGARGLTQIQGHVASPGPRGTAPPGLRTQPHPGPGARGLTRTQGHAGKSEITELADAVSEVADVSHSKFDIVLVPRSLYLMPSCLSPKKEAPTATYFLGLWECIALYNIHLNSNSTSTLTVAISNTSYSPSSPIELLFSSNNQISSPPESSGYSEELCTFLWPIQSANQP
ncbi:hypothetical protein QTO34_005557, partial [Cnephaeus nilssonii]